MSRNLNSSFKLIGVLSLMLSATFFTNSNAAVADNYLASCIDVGLVPPINENGFRLMAFGKCLGVGPTPRAFTAIVVSDIIRVNPQGRLEWLEADNLHPEWSSVVTCTNLSFGVHESPPPFRDLAILSATCRNEAGQEVFSTIDLNQFISNHNRRLVYDLYPGLGAYPP